MGEHVVCSEQVLLPVFLSLARESSAGAKQIAQACCTCKAFRDVGSSDVIWKKLFKETFWIFTKGDNCDLFPSGYKALYGAKVTRALKYWNTVERVNDNFLRRCLSE